MTLTRAEAEALRHGRRPVKRESEIQREILAYLSLVPGVYVWRQNAGAMFGAHKGKRWAVRFGAVGMSDIIGWVETRVVQHDVWPVPSARFVTGDTVLILPRWLAIEVKRPGGVPTAAQQAFLGRVREAGGLALVAHSVAEVRAALAGGGRTP